MLPGFQLARPTSLAEALGLIGEDAVPICGGTELLLSMRAGLQRPPRLVDLKRIPGLESVAVDGEELVIGGLARHARLSTDPTVADRCRVLTEVEARVGNARVRAQGSIGGNLCFAEPKSDVATCLLALDATVTLVSASGSRRLGVGDFIQGPYYADREPEELLTEVRIPIRARQRAAYRKFQITERPTVGVAVVVDDDFGSCVMTVGAAGEVPVRGECGSLDDAADLADDLAAEVDYISDVTGSPRYKRHLVGVIARRTIDAVGVAGTTGAAGTAVVDSATDVRHDGGGSR